MFGFSIFAHAQATPTASRAGDLQVGAGFTWVKPDYSGGHDKGPTFYATYDFMQHIGVEGDIHYASIIAPNDVGEDSYLIGPRFVYKKKRFTPYAKVLFGVGTLNLQFDTSPHSKTTQFAYAVGAGLDYRLTHSINIRAFDFEYQHWSYLTGLTPLVYTVGVAYSFH
jgi:opacity protein-like surface antigen